MDKSVFLAARNVSKAFSSGSRIFASLREVKALDCIHFSMTKGEALGIIGESGSGKSTLAKIIMGMESFDSGELIFENLPLAQWHSRMRVSFLRKVQMVFQDPISSFNPKRKMGAQLESVLKNLCDFDQAKRQNRIKECLEITRMNETALEKYPLEFSGGQAQRLAIARALLPNPDLLILDEAVSALDVSVQATILNLLKDLHKDLNISLIFIGHDLAVVEYLCPRIIVMQNGMIIEDSNRSTIFSNPEKEYTKRLTEAVYTL